MDVFLSKVGTIAVQIDGCLIGQLIRVYQCPERGHDEIRVLLTDHGETPPGESLSPKASEVRPVFRIRWKAEQACAARIH
jgi:hypothetical protein